MLTLFMGVRNGLCGHELKHLKRTAVVAMPRAQVRRAGQITFVSMSSVLPQLRREAQPPEGSPTGPVRAQQQQQQQPMDRRSAGSGTVVRPSEETGWLACVHRSAQGTAGHGQLWGTGSVQASLWASACRHDNSEVHSFMVCSCGLPPGGCQGAAGRTGEAASSSAWTEAGAPSAWIATALVLMLMTWPDVLWQSICKQCKLNSRRILTSISGCMER